MEIFHYYVSFPLRVVSTIFSTEFQNVKEQLPGSFAVKNEGAVRRMSGQSIATKPPFGHPKKVVESKSPKIHLVRF